MKKKFRILPLFADNYITVALTALMIFGTLMIASAEMGSEAGNVSAIIGVMIRQVIYLTIGTIAYIALSYISLFNFPKRFYTPIMVIAVSVILVATRLFPPSGGAYAWLRFGSFTIQPSEFAKVFIIVLIAKMFTLNFRTNEETRYTFVNLMLTILFYTAIIFGVQKDTGSAVILFGIGFLLLLIPKHKAFYKYQRYMFIFLVACVIIVLLILSPMGTVFLESLDSDSYMIGRFLAAADPFKDQYASGYHLVMSLVAFATGGLFGVGYGNSVHKYMNFPNPSNDFILPVIVEELGILGLCLILLMYGTIIFRLIKHMNNKAADIRSKLVFMGVILYFSLHFILNVGGVSGLIPLTGVPLLLISSGGSSAMAAMCALGIAQNEIVRTKRREDAQNNSREV